MPDNTEFESKIAEYKRVVTELAEPAGAEVIEQTAQRLESVQYAPPVVLPVPKFLRLTSAGLLAEIDSLLDLPDEEACALAPDEPGRCQDLRLQFISTLIYYFEKLLKLRAGEPEEWDEIDELYIHD